MVIRENSRLLHHLVNDARYLNAADEQPYFQYRITKFRPSVKNYPPAAFGDLCLKLAEISGRRMLFFGC